MILRLIGVFLVLNCILPIVSAEVNPFAVISISNPEIKVLTSKEFSWSDKSRYVYEDERLNGFPVENVFQNDIKLKLTSNGFIYNEDKSTTGLLVGYVLALESSLNDMDINNLYGINPGFINKDAKKRSQNYEKGTIIIDILEARTNRNVWRGAIQGMAEFGISSQEREARLKNAVDVLLNEFLKTYGNK